MSERIRKIATDIRKFAIGFSGRKDLYAYRDVKERQLGGDSLTAADSTYTPPSAPHTFSPTQGFGITRISPSEMLFASQREPIIKWLVYWVASDIFDNWFEVIDPAREEDRSLDEAVQRVLLQLKAKPQLTRLIQFERRYGTAVLLCAYTGTDDDDWPTSIYDENGNLKGNRQLLQISPYPWTKVNIVDLDAESSSFRYGWPEKYEIQRGGGLLGTSAHWSRVIHAATRLDEQVYEGESVIYAIYDDATGFRNSRWAQYETLFRYGSGFPHIHLPNATPAQVAAWIAGGNFSDINARGFFVSTGVGDEAESIEFIGVKGVTLNPDPYNEMAAWNLAMASRIPQDILKGVSAGRITGSEVNERAYFKFINAEQSSVEPIVRELIDRLIATGQIAYTDGRRSAIPRDYVIKWKYPQLTPEQSQAQINYLNARAQTERLEFMTIDEVRAKADPPLPPLPEGKGDVCIGVETAKRGGEVSPFASNPERREEEKTTEDEGDGEDELSNMILKSALEKKR